MRALDLFRDGHNTQDIARFLTAREGKAIREGEAYNMLAKEREQERIIRFLRTGRNPEGKILYAGAE